MDTITSSGQIGTSSRLTLHLGVVVQPYRATGRLAKTLGIKRGALTTGDVAGFLEAKYGLMATFYRVHQTDIARALEGSLGGALEALMMGKAINPWGRATQAIQQQFRDFISSQEAERVGIPGTPTLAALTGVNHRLKHPYAKRNPRRPSFRDTGLLMNSFVSWVD